MIIKSMKAVGMHHHGNRSLIIDAVYQVKREPENPYDRKACAIVDGNRTVAYLDRRSARLIAEIADQSIISGPIYLKPKHPLDVKSQREGPYHFCNVGFKIHSHHIDSLQSITKHSPYIVSMTRSSR